MAIEALTAKDFETKVLDADKPVVIDVWAPWCGPCRAMAPHFEEAAGLYRDRVEFFKLNSDENQDLVRRFRIMGIPTLLYFRNGELVDRKVGLQNAQAIGRRLEALLVEPGDEAKPGGIKGWLQRIVGGT